MIEITDRDGCRHLIGRKIKSIKECSIFCDDKVKRWYGLIIKSYVNEGYSSRDYLYSEIFFSDRKARNYYYERLKGFIDEEVENIDFK